MIGDRYKIIEQLGRGGMGVVFKAHDTRLDRIVAIKRILEPDVQTLARFRQEARAIAALQHENIRAVHDLAEDRIGPFLVMEYVEGETLEHRVTSRGALAPAELINLARALGRAIAHAHRHDIIHRDIKPSNVLMGTDGTLKLCDFGLARIGPDPFLTRAGYGMGTPIYASPEQLRDASSVDHRTDLYSLGATLYFAASGEHTRIIRAARAPVELREVVLRCLQDVREARHASADIFLAALDAGHSQQQRVEPVTPVLPGVKCLECSAINPTDRRFCRRCGTRLTEPCPRCSQENARKDRHCGHCGVDIKAWQQAQDHLMRASIDLALGAWTEAGKEARLALAAVPGHPEASRIWHEAQDKAQHALRRAKEEAAWQIRRAELAEEHMLEALKMEQQEKWYLAKSAWERVLRYAPDNARAAEALAAVLEQLRQAHGRIIAARRAEKAAVTPLSSTTAHDAEDGGDTDSIDTTSTKISVRIPKPGFCPSCGKPEPADGNVCPNCNAFMDRWRAANRHAVVSIRHYKQGEWAQAVTAARRALKVVPGHEVAQQLVQASLRAAASASAG